MSPMLERVDYPVIVQKPDRRYDLQIDILDLHKAAGIGRQEGWNKAIIELIKAVIHNA